MFVFFITPCPVLSLGGRTPHKLEKVLERNIESLFVKKKKKEKKGTGRGKEGGERERGKKGKQISCIQKYMLNSI